MLFVPSYINICEYICEYLFTVHVKLAMFTSAVLVCHRFLGCSASCSSPRKFCVYLNLPTFQNFQQWVFPSQNTIFVKKLHYSGLRSPKKICRRRPARLRRALGGAAPPSPTPPPSLHSCLPSASRNIREYLSPRLPPKYSKKNREYLRKA